MNLPGSKYFFFTSVLLLLSSGSIGQVTLASKTIADTGNHLNYYHLLSPAKPARPYTKLNYNPPTNQLMSWPNYPLSAEGVIRNMDQHERDNKLSNQIIKDIVTSLLSKKKRVAVIPKY